MPVHPNAKNMREEHIALAPVFHSPAVARCCKAWNRAFKAHREGGTNPVSIYLRANEACQRHAAPLQPSATSLLGGPATILSEKIKFPAVRLWTGILLL